MRTYHIKRFLLFNLFDQYIDDITYSFHLGDVHLIRRQFGLCLGHFVNFLRDHSKVDSNGVSL